MKNKSKYANPISERIAKKTEERGMTIYELCKKTDHKPAKFHVAKKRSNSFSSSIMIADFAEALGTTSDYFIKGKKTPLNRDHIIQQLIKEKIEYKTKYETVLLELNKIKKLITNISDHNEPISNL